MGAAAPGEAPGDSRRRKLPAELASLASALGQDAHIDLEIGRGWSWDPARRVLTVDRDELARRGARYCAGVIAHEVGHVLISRYLSFPSPLPETELSRRACYQVLNGVEDPRVERWMVRRFPGALPWLEAGRGEAHTPAGATSVFMSFCFECAAEGERDFAPAEGVLPPGVRGALERTRAARRRYSRMTPAPDLSSDDPRLRERYVAEVQPQLSGPRWLPSRREQAVRLSAWQAHTLAAAQILPEAAALFRRDRDRIARRLQQDPALAAQGRAHLRGERAETTGWPGLEAALRPENQGDSAKEDSKGGAPSAALTELASALLDDAMAGSRREPLLAGATPGGRSRPAGGRAPGARSPGAPRGAAGPAPRRPLALPPSAAPYDVAYRQVAPQVDRLVHHLEQVLRPRQRMARRSGYPSGQRLDMRRVMTWEADPRQWDRIWSRNSIPERRDVAIGLLVDLSGSMSGEPVHHALLGTILLAETLHRLQVPFAIDGFQDALIPFHGFDEPFDVQVRASLAQMPLEVECTRPGGHNESGYNDDGPCLLEFAEKLRQRQATDRVLVALSDGEPAGRRSDEADLRAAVATLSAPGAGLRLIGLGLGPGTDHVRGFYPEHEANVPLPALARRIGALLERVLVGRS